MGKTIKPIRYNLNQIPYEYAVEVTHRLKRLNPVNSVPEELRTEVCNYVQEAVNKTVAKKKKRRQSGYLRLKMAEERREVKSNRERER